ncbi:SDR family NAD(P)-dependent oxidoreductase [Aquabacter spiritensis]|uniref:NAD(P)-dependent dehydrogenase (Short-subunit alcohol dehydrogenase family) n=1 Tax=Aquabacter spiritensis TaxID=933073 RepID=A0A4R3M5V0_9HYPH|nr:SDR family oxidoreductase [Aquabacter spiritensis]TCT08316.1 NAD(P)-dependent dehydrogenase (short-subunit alcohol dehydrogenase family) [Aquabacter spiritensis]
METGGSPRAALVTGAAAGLGHAIAMALARSGTRVALADIAEEGLAQAAQACGPGSVALPLDLRHADSITACLAAAAEKLGPLDLLVNNAGVALHRPALDLTWSEWDTVLDVNLKGAFFMSQAFGARLVAEKRPGAIVNIASTHGIVALADRAAYGIAKAGVIHLTKMLAVEWARFGIRVNAIAPGTVMTPSRAELLKAPEARARMLDRIPLGRFPTAQEVAEAVLYLAGDGAASVTGHTLVLDGGTTVC